MKATSTAAVGISGPVLLTPSRTKPETAISSAASAKSISVAMARAGPKGGRRQAQAVWPCGAAKAMPFSVSSGCSSPAWNISRMMSQPPTNSPLT